MYYYTMEGHDHHDHAHHAMDHAMDHAMNHAMEHNPSASEECPMSMVVINRPEQLTRTQLAQINFYFSSTGPLVRKFYLMDGTQTLCGAS